jgi:SWIM zinc finger
VAHFAHTYRYAEPSTIDLSGGAHVKLATSSPGNTPNPHFFDCTLHQPQLAAQLLSAVHLLVGSRFFTPANSVGLAIALADPVVTSGGGILRLEGFSACCSTYIRVDMEPQAYAGDVVGKGTTNIDFNAPMRAALAKVRDADGMALSVGSAEFALRTAGAKVVEKKVELPLRWLRSMVAVQAYQAAMHKVIEVGSIAALRFLRSLPKTSTSKTPLWVVAGPQGLRTTTQIDGAGVRFTDCTRLRVLESLLPKAKTLTLYADAHQQASAWCLDFGHMRLTLVLSAEVWRGFSGEGQALQALVLSDESYPVSTVRAQLNWQDALRSDTLAEQLRWPVPDVDRALQVLGVSGLVGFDLAHGAYFHRVLPFDLSQLEDMHPRLVDARSLLRTGAVSVVSASPLEALVQSADISYRVREVDGLMRCTCTWFAKHQGERGPCKHVLAAQAALNFNACAQRHNDAAD